MTSTTRECCSKCEDRLGSTALGYTPKCLNSSCPCHKQTLDEHHFTIRESVDSDGSLKTEFVQTGSWEVLREKCADIEHTRWAKWQKYFFDQCIFEGEKNGYVQFALPVPKYERWLRQIATSYSALSEQEKDSDRREVDSYLPLFRSLLQAERDKVLGEVEKILKELKLEHEKGESRDLFDKISAHNVALTLAQGQIRNASLLKAEGEE